MAQSQQLNYTHFVAVQLVNVVNDLVGTVNTWSSKKNDVYYGKADSGVPIQNGKFVNTNEINDDVIRNAIYYLYNKRKTEGIEEFGAEENEIFGASNPTNVLFLGMKKVNEKYTGHIVTKITSNKMGLYYFEYHPKNKNIVRSPIQNLRLEPQLSKAAAAAAAATAATAKTVEANVARAAAAAAAAAAKALKDKNAERTISELLSEITQSRVASSPPPPPPPPSSSSSSTVKTSNPIEFHWKTTNNQDDGITVRNIPVKGSMDIKKDDIMSYLGSLDKKKRYIWITGFAHSGGGPPKAILYLVYRFSKSKTEWRWEGATGLFGQTHLPISPEKFGDYIDLEHTQLTKDKAEELTKAADNGSSSSSGAAPSRKGGKRNSKGNRKTQKKRKTQPKKKPKKKSVRKTSKK